MSLTLRVSALVRRWEDASVNGVEDINGTLIPFRKGSLWCPSIDLETGQICDWPTGVSAYIHYKVCDKGEYWLVADGVTYRWRGDYVPDDLLCHVRHWGSRGWGDYIVLDVNNKGFIEHYKPPTIDWNEWRKMEVQP